ncbi:MAG: winged helix-turn-helix domain-containing protein [Promethearchaeota archaeon]
MWSGSYKHWKNNSTRRNKFEIWSEILEACNRVPRTQSWLLRELRLKTSAIKESLLFLMERELIYQVDEENSGVIGYLATDKGKEALRNYYNLITKYFKPYKK